MSLKPTFSVLHCAAKVGKTRGTERRNKLAKAMKYHKGKSAANTKKNLGSLASGLSRFGPKSLG